LIKWLSVVLAAAVGRIIDCIVGGQRLSTHDALDHIVGCIVDFHSVAKLFDAIHFVRLTVNGQRPTRPSDAVDLIVGPLTGWPEVGQTVRGC